MKFFFPRLLKEFLCGHSVSRFFVDQEIPGILWNLKVITVFIRSQLLFPFRATFIHLTPCHPISCRCILISFSNRCLHLPRGLLLCVSLRKSCVCLSFACVLYAPPIPFCLIWSPKQYFVWSTKHVLIIHFIMFLYYFLLIRSKYLSQHSVLNHPQSMFFT